ncbi:MAG: hypothetical protein MPL62_05540 [Alphaproteobacteria bacterium]|nr:hypothetical protein [Alphaproteobacteria bacterium]
MSADFLLPDDKGFLAGIGYDWNYEEEAGKRGLIIQNYRLPAGYSPEQSDFMLLIPANYPMDAIDMFYFDPGIARADGLSINALEYHEHFGRTWQRWSRHYSWQPGVHSVATHVCYVGNQLEFELE